MCSRDSLSANEMQVEAMGASAVSSGRVSTVLFPFSLAHADEFNAKQAKESDIIT